MTHDWEDAPEVGMTVVRCKRCRCYEPHVYACSFIVARLQAGCEPGIKTKCNCARNPDGSHQ